MLNVWDTICKRVTHTYEMSYKKRCNELGIHDSVEVPYLMINSFDYGLQEYISFMNNPFLPVGNKLCIQQLYSICRRRFLSIKRFIVRIIYRRRKSCNLVDLSYTPFTEYSPSLCIYIMDDKKKYTFTHSELYNIIENSLTNSDMYMISNPLPIKNPYTGIPLSKEILYFLYLNMKHLPLVFRHFANTHFNIHIFLLESESILRQHQINKRVLNIPLNDLRQEMQDMVIEMCFYISYSLNIEACILNSSSNEKECRQMLRHYYNYMYSLNPYQRQCECKTVIVKIKNMYVKPI